MIELSLVVYTHIHSKEDRGKKCGQHLEILPVISSWEVAHPIFWRVPDLWEKICLVLQRMQLETKQYSNSPGPSSPKYCGTRYRKLIKEDLRNISWENSAERSQGPWTCPEGKALPAVNGEFWSMALLLYLEFDTEVSPIGSSWRNVVNTKGNQGETADVFKNTELNLQLGLYLA